MLDSEIFSILLFHFALRKAPKWKHFNFQETPENLYPAAAINVSHHLSKLLKEGRTKNDGDLFWSA